MAIGLTGRPQILGLVASADAAHLRASSARGGYWPTVQVGASLQRAMNLSSYDALFNPNPKNSGPSASA